MCPGWSSSTRWMSVGANFPNVLDDIRERLEGRPVALTIPIGSGSPKDSPTPFAGIIDLIERQAVFFDKAARRQGVPHRPNPGRHSRLRPVTGANACSMRSLRKTPPLAEAYLAELDGQGEVGPSMIRESIRRLTLAQHIQPVLCGSGREHIGIQPLLDAVCWYLPSPLDRPPVTGTNPKKPDKEEQRKPDPKEPFCGLVFKLVADTHGDLFYVRVYSGTLKSNTRPYNPGKQIKEFASKLYHTHADPDSREEIAEACYWRHCRASSA